MEKRKFGKTGLEVSALGFGGAEIGFEETSEKQTQDLLNQALDAGLNVIDTAECYLASEELIGKTVSHRRKDFYLFSKCGHSHGYEDTDWKDIKRLEASLERSLKRLKTDHLDLFQLHSCSKEILERGDVIDFMKRAKAAGKTRFIGYSGDDEAALYAVQTGAFETLQTSINIADQQAIDLTVPEAAKRQMGIIAKRPIANAVWKHRTRPLNDYVVPYWDRLQKLQYDFAKDSDKAAAIALRFTLSVPGVSVAIVGTKKPGRWQDNARVVAEGSLDSQTFNSIRKHWKQVAARDWVGQT